MALGSVFGRVEVRCLPDPRTGTITQEPHAAAEADDTDTEARNEVNKTDEPKEAPPSDVPRPDPDKDQA